MFCRYTYTYIIIYIYICTYCMNLVCMWCLIAFNCFNPWKKNGAKIENSWGRCPNINPIASNCNKVTKLGEESTILQDMLMYQLGILPVQLIPSFLHDLLIQIWLGSKLMLLACFTHCGEDVYSCRMSASLYHIQGTPHHDIFHISYLDKW